jgi:hypothetical protein
LIALQDEIAFARSAKQVKADVDPVQITFELHAYVQEANWAFKLFNDKSAFSRVAHGRKCDRCYLDSNPDRR